MSLPLVLSLANGDTTPLSFPLSPNPSEAPSVPLVFPHGFVKTTQRQNPGPTFLPPPIKQSLSLSPSLKYSHQNRYPSLYLTVSPTSLLPHFKSRPLSLLNPNSPPPLSLSFFLRGCQMEASNGGSTTAAAVAIGSSD